MADLDKNILITPQISQTADPTIEFKSGAAVGDPITLSVTDDGTITTLDFSGSAGQLFSISNDLTGTIFAVSDSSGIPIIEADVDGTIRLSEFGGNVGIGSTTPTHKLHLISDAFTGVRFERNGAGGGIGVQFKNGDANIWELSHGGDEVFRFSYNGTDYVTVSGGTVTATTFSGALSGNATSASSATNATNAANAQVDADNSTNAAHYITFVGAATGNQRLNSDTDLSYNPSTNTITVANLAGNASSATNATNAANIQVDADNATNATHYPVFTGGATGNQRANSDSGLTYNPSTNTLTTTTFDGNATSATNATNAANVQVDADETTNATHYITFVGGTTGNQRLNSDTGLTWNPSSGLLDMQDGSRLGVNRIDTANGQHLVLNAGESGAYANGQTNEFVYINAESGLSVTSSPDNWDSANAGVNAWANRNTAVIINASDGSSTFNNVTINGNLTVTGTTTTNNVETVSTSNGVIFEGNAADANELTLLAGTLTADRTITLPDATGTVALTSQLPTVGNGQLTVSGGGVLGGTGTFTANQSGNTSISITHDAVTRTNNTSTASPAHGGTFTAIDSITTSTEGHVTAVNTKTVTLPADNNTNNYVSGTAFNTETGVLTLNRSGLGDLTQDLDNRWVQQPYDVVPGYNNNDYNSIRWSSAEAALEIQDSSDTTTGGVFPAFRVDEGGIFDITFQIKSSTTAANGIYIRIYEYDAELPGGKTHVSNDAVNAVVQEDTRQAVLSPTYENQAATTDWQTLNFTYTPTSTAVWASVVVLNWTGLGNNSLYIRQPKINRQFSSSASNNTAVLRHPSGYIYANYFNTSPNDIADGGITKMVAESGNDGFMRHATASVVRTFLNVANGATANAGTVTSVSAGAGMDFTTITSSGPVTLGTPSTLTDVTTNSASGTTHTHAITGFPTQASTRLGLTSHSLVNFTTLGDYSKAAGYQTFMRGTSQEATVVGTPVAANYWYYNVMAKRDTAGGTAATLMNYDNGDFYVGLAATSSDALVWRRTYLDTDFTTNTRAPNAATTSANRSYEVQRLSTDSTKLIVNVPWVDTNTDTNTTYTISSLEGTADDGTVVFRLSGSDSSTDDINFENTTTIGFTSPDTASIQAYINDGAVGGTQLADGSVANAKLADMAANTVKVRNAGTAGVPSDLAVTNTQILIGNGAGFTAASLSGDVSMTNAGVVTVSNDSHTHAFNNLTGKTAGTGDYSTTGDLVAGRGSGSIALTINDGKGNSNITFNHQDGVPDNVSATQSAYRIEASTDSNTAQMSFEMGNSTTQNTSVDLTQWMSATLSAVTIVPNLNVSNGLDVTGTLTADSEVTLTRAAGNNAVALTAGGAINLYSGTAYGFDNTLRGDVTSNDVLLELTGNAFEVQDAANANNFVRLAKNGNITLSGTVDGRDVAADGTKLDGIANNANNYSLPLAANGTRGGVQIGYAENGKNYPVELSSEKMFVNVPWTDNNTTYSAGDGLTLSGTTFSVTGGEIPGSTDLNTYRTSGIYPQNANADATSGSNYPIAQAGILQVINDDYGNGLHTTQLYSQYNSTNLWHRTYYNGTWQSWRNLAQDTNTDTNTTYSLSAVDATPTADDATIRLTAGGSGSGSEDVVLAGNSNIEFRVVSAGTIDALIKNDAIGNAKLANMAANTIKGAVSAGDPVDLTAAQVRTIIGDATASTAGLVSTGAQTWAGTKSFADDLLPDTDNTGAIGNGTFTWASGRFTDFQVDATLFVRGAIDLADGDVLRFGTSDDYIFNYNGTTNELTIHANTSGDLFITDAADVKEFFFDISAGDFHADGDVIAFSTSIASDINLKQNIQVVDGALQKVQKLRGVTFDWIDEEKGSSAGVIAQEVEAVLPEAVSDIERMGNENDVYKSVNYNAIHALLIEAIKEQQEQIEALKAEVAALKK